MRSKYFLGLGLLVGGFALAGSGTGCDGGGTGGTGGGTGGGTSSSSSSTTTSSSSSTSGDPCSGGNHAFECAEPIEVSSMSGATAGTLVDADTTKNFYKFTGTKGDRVVAIADAQGLAGTNGDDNTVIDPVLTIYDANKVQISQNDDQWPRFGRDSQLFTVLPSTGDFYLVVEDCNTAFPGAGCAPPGEVLTFDYEVQINKTDAVVAPEFNAAEPNDNQGAAIAITYTKTNNTYGTVLVNGSFGAAADNDYFTFTAPADTTVDASGRAHAEIWAQPIGADNGDGSTVNTKIQIIDDMTQAVIAEIDQANHSNGGTNSPVHMSVPIALDRKYYMVFLPSGTPSKPDTDYYFTQNFVGSFYYGEYENEVVAGGNDTVATAQALTTPMMVTSHAVFVDGDLDFANDVDIFSYAVPAGDTLVSIFCDAQRQGSGLRGAKFTLLDGAGNPITGGSFTEAANKDGFLTDVQMPANTTTVYLKVEATLAPSATVEGRYYHCTLVTGVP